LELLLKESGMTESQLEKDDEKKPGFWEQFTLEKERYLVFMKAAMYRFAGEHDCIIVGRGANIIFRGIPGALKLRIIAPSKIRVARLRERLGIDEQHALRMIHQSDHDRAGYHKYFFNAVWDSPADYDLVVNTAAISPAEVCDTVSALLCSPAYAKAGGPSRDVLRDLRIAQDTLIAIIYRERVPVVSLDVVCDKGVVALHGAVRFPAAMDRCAEIAGAVEGVVKVVSYMEVVEYAYYPGL
ncbi:MAG TPA: cytidylate kinase family protein, partial [Spirochaetia bacterium]|nr:cytidylate kinase family protein [Spirochaetia bacterium]